MIGADVMTSILDFEDRTTCVLFGDGAGAVLLEPREDGTGILDFAHEVDGSGACYLNMPGGGSLKPATHETVDAKLHYVRQQGQHVFKYAVRKFADDSAAILRAQRAQPAATSTSSSRTRPTSASSTPRSTAWGCPTRR